MNKWPEQRLKHRVSVNPRPPSLPDGAEVSFVPMEAVGELGGLTLDQSRQAADVRQGYTGFVDGDVVLAKITPCFENGKGALAVDLLNGVAFGTTELHVLRPTASVDRRWLFYLTLSHHFRKLGEAEMYGAGGQKRVPPSYLANYRVAFPSMEEQHAIADFLDRKTTAIDALLRKKERLVELLQEKRQALITQAVTKGLDSNVPMKDSGIEWLGEIPKHWNAKPLKQLSRRISGRLVYQPAQYFSEEGVPFIMGNNVTERGITLSDTKLIPADVNARFARHALRAGDVVTVRVGAPGVTAVVSDEVDGLNCGSLMIIRRNDSFDSEWLAFVMNSPIVRGQIDLVQYGAAQEQINIKDAINFLIPTPPIAEQRTISATLSERTRHINATVNLIREQTTRLQEYRRGLISAAVTGQLRVGGERAA